LNIDGFIKTMTWYKSVLILSKKNYYIPSIF